METVICLGLIGAIYLFWKVLWDGRNNGVVQNVLWELCSLRFDVPAEEMTFDGHDLAYIPRAQGTLIVSYPLLSLPGHDEPAKPIVCTTRYKGLNIPAWFEYITIKEEHDKGFFSAMTFSRRPTLRCGGVDLSSHIPLVFKVLFEEDSSILQELKQLSASIISGTAVLTTHYSTSTELNWVVDDLEGFALLLERMKQHIPEDLESVLLKLILRTEDSELFESLYEALSLEGNASNRAQFASLAFNASPGVMALWCMHGLIDVVRPNVLGHQGRREVFVHWAKRASLEDRAISTPQGVELVEYFCEHETLESLKLTTLNSTPRLVLPLMMHFFEEAPQDVWAQSKVLIALMRTDEAYAWLKHLETSGYPVDLEHLVRMRKSKLISPDSAQDLMRYIMEGVQEQPLMMSNIQLNNTIMYLLKYIGDDVFTQVCDWLIESGTVVTLKCMHAKIADHFPSRSKQSRLLDGVFEGLTYRAGHAGGLSLSADAQTGGLSASSAAHQGDMTFAFDEDAPQDHLHQTSVKAHDWK